MDLDETQKMLDGIIEKYRSDKYPNCLEMISYYAERPDKAIIQTENFISAFNDIKLLSDNIYYFHLSYITIYNFYECSGSDYCFVIKDNSGLSAFIIHNYSGILEDNENVKLFSDLPESYNDGYGEYIISKQDMTLEIKPYEAYNITSVQKYQMPKENDMFKNAAKRERITRPKRRR